MKKTGFLYLGILLALLSALVFVLLSHESPLLAFAVSDDDQYFAIAKLISVDSPVRTLNKNHNYFFWLASVLVLPAMFYRIYRASAGKYLPEKICSVPGPGVRAPPSIF